MRVSRVKAHLGKVLEYIRSLDGEHTMYSKTLDQFNEMADMCQEIIDEIRKITNNGCENKLSGDGIESMFLELKGDISMLKRAIRVPESCVL